MRSFAAFPAFLALCSTAAAEQPEPAAAERAARSDAYVVDVLWGAAYRRAGLGAGLSHSVPLMRRPGALWESTNVAFGVREFYGYVNNSLGAWVEATPIAVFKLAVSASWDNMIVEPFDGGLRVLSPEGRALFGAGRAGPDAGELGWKDGGNRRAGFLAPVRGDGWRVKAMPTLQAKVGPVGVQYNFTADWNFYRGAGAGADDVFHDTYSFTLRRMRDVGFFHEGVVAIDLPSPGALLAGISAKYYAVSGTGLESLSLVGFAQYRTHATFFDGRLQPWGAVQAGSFLVDPMYRGAFSWVAAVGADMRVR